MKATIMVTIVVALFATSLVFSQDNIRYYKFEKKTMEGIKFGLFDSLKNIEILPAKYDNIGDIKDGMIPIMNDTKVGFADTSGKIVIPMLYDGGTGEFSEGVTFMLKGEKLAMINKKGTSLTQFIYDNVLGLSEGIGRVVINRKIGFVNNQGVQIIPCKFDEAYDCSYGLILCFSSSWESFATVYQQDKYGNVGSSDVGVARIKPGIFNKQGKLIYAGANNEKVKYTKTGKAIITKDQYNSEPMSKMIDNTGKVIISFEQNYCLTINDNWVDIKTPKGYFYSHGIMDFDGKILLKPNFSKISDFTFGNGAFAQVFFDDGTFFYVDKSWKCMEYDNVKCPE
jgi:hypothetical protein